MTIETTYTPGDFVEHVLDEPGSPGLVVAFMLRGQNHSYQVQWDSSKDGMWHLDYELRRASQKKTISLTLRTTP